jgi:hypothetical protein
MKIVKETKRGVRDKTLRRKQTGLAPSPPEERWRRGWGEEADFIGLPLSLTLSPFVPHGERESVHCTSI